MNNIPYVHYSKDKNSLLKTYFIALIPLILFSFYKNGLMLYQNSFISFIDMFIPLYFYLISIGVGFLVSYLNKENKWEYILYSLIIACSISINTNKIIYPILLFIALFTTSYLAKKHDFNFLASSRVLIILALFIGSYSYLNVAEKLNAFNYDIFDLLFKLGLENRRTAAVFCLRLFQASPAGAGSMMKFLTGELLFINRYHPERNRPGSWASGGTFLWSSYSSRAI